MRKSPLLPVAFGCLVWLRHYNFFSHNLANTRVLQQRSYCRQNNQAGGLRICFWRREGMQTKAIHTPIASMGSCRRPCGVVLRPCAGGRSSVCPPSPAPAHTNIPWLMTAPSAAAAAMLSALLVLGTDSPTALAKEPPGQVGQVYRGKPTSIADGDTLTIAGTAPFRLQGIGAQAAVRGEHEVAAVA